MKIRCKNCGTESDNKSVEVAAIVVAAVLIAGVFLYLYPPESKITYNSAVELSANTTANLWGVVLNMTLNSYGRAQHCLKEYDAAFDVTSYRCEFDGDIYYGVNQSLHESARLRFWCYANVCGTLPNLIRGTYKRL